MDSLPNELLRAVIETFVLELCGDPKILCSISRKWLIAALLTPKVWSRIALAHDSRPLAWNRLPDASYTICETEDRLKTILARTGSTKLDVYIGANSLKALSKAWTTIDRDWFAKRCRKLTSWGPVLADDPWVRGLAELEEVIFPREDSISLQLCKDMQAHSLKFSSVEMKVYDATILASFPALVARLRTLRILRNGLNIGPHSNTLPRLDCVEELLWTELSSSNPLPPTTTHLRTLTLAHYRHLEAPQTVWNSLTELELDSAHTVAQTSLVLPTLETLVLRQSWAALAWINAPVIRTLRLFKSPGGPDYRHEARLPCTLRPPVIYIETSGITMTLIHMLQGVWLDVEELHCTYVPSLILDQLAKEFLELVDYLSKTWSTHGKAKVCSQLKTFTTIFDCGLWANSRIDVASVASAMERMVKIRGGFYPLTVALLGIKSSNSYGDSTEWSSFA